MSKGTRAANDLKLLLNCVQIGNIIQIQIPLLDDTNTSWTPLILSKFLLCFVLQIVNSACFILPARTHSATHNKSHR